VQTLQHHCLNHAEREAAARCPQCREFFCRECIVEHDDRILCAGCLAKLTKTAGPKGDLRKLTRVVSAAVGLCAAWLFFYWAGQILLTISPDFHSGEMWKTSFWGD
jgi:hypothetical protein